MGKKGERIPGEVDPDSSETMYEVLRAAVAAAALYDIESQVQRPFAQGMGPPPS